MSALFVTGDLFATPGIQAAAHGVNMSGVMGAGIAVEFKKRYPAMHQEYLEICHRGLRELGQVHRWDSAIADPKHPAGEFSFVFNCFTQKKPGKNADYDAVAHSVYETMRQCQHLGVEYLGLPLIGTGIGGLEVEPVKEIYQYVANKFPETDMIAFDVYVKGIPYAL